MENENYTHTPEEPNPKKTGRKGFYIKIVALALCCSLLGGLLGGGAVLLAGNHLIESNLSEMLEDGKDFVIESRTRMIHPWGFALGAAKEFFEKEVVYEPYIGVTVSDSTDPTGALIESVEKGSPAAKGGLQEDDVITLVNNTKIYSRDKLAEIVSQSDVGDELTLTVYRRGETFDCSIVIGEHSRFGD